MGQCGLSSETEEYCYPPTTNEKKRKSAGHKRKDDNMDNMTSFSRDFYDTPTVSIPNENIGNGTIVSIPSENDTNGNAEFVEDFYGNPNGAKKPMVASIKGGRYKSLARITKSMRQGFSTYNNIHKLVDWNVVRNSERENYAAGVVGMKNLGNTCFMNSSLQCLSNTIPLADYFLGYDYKSEINKDNFLGTGGKLATEYAELMKQIWLSQPKSSPRSRKKYQSISPHRFKSVLETFSPTFVGYQQHDAQELLAFLLDGIHEDLNRVNDKPYIEDKDCDGSDDHNDSILAWQNYLKRNKSIIVDLFQGQLRNTLTCQNPQPDGSNGCGHKNIKFEPFMYLSLPVNDHTRSLNDCLQLFCREEHLAGDDSWYCPKCRTHVPSSKKLDLWMLPPILIIHLKRFKVRTGFGGTLHRTKIKQNIEYPVHQWDLKFSLQSSQHDCPLYDLYAVSHHVGDLSSGHYTAQALNRVTNQWFEFNDSYCSTIEHFPSHSRSAYCLFYNRIGNTRNENGRGNIPLVRRQTLSRPEHWPHMQNYDGDDFRSFRRGFNDSIPIHGDGLASF